MSILIANGRQRNIGDFTYYGEGPGKEGDPDNTSALSVDLERGVVTARQWDLRDFRDEDPDSEPEWGMQEVRIDLDDLMRSGTKSTKFRQTYSGDLGWSLEDLRAMSAKDRKEAIIAVAISRLAYGPNDESIVEGIGSTDEVYRNNTGRKRNPHRDLCTCGHERFMHGVYDKATFPHTKVRDECMKPQCRCKAFVADTSAKKTNTGVALPPLGVFVGRLAAASHDPGRAVTYRVTLHGEDAALVYSLLQRIGPAYQWDVRGSEFIFVGATALHALLTALLKVQGKEHDRAVNLVRAALDRLGF